MSRRDLLRLTVGTPLGVALLFAPAYAGPGPLGVLITTAVIAIAALGLDVLVGRTGQLSLAQGAFLGTGAFTAIGVGAAGAPWPLAFLAAMTVTAALAALVGLPALRIRGLQVAIATLAFQLFAVQFLFQRPEVKSSTRFFDRPDYLGDTPLYYLALVFVGLVALLLHRLDTTKAGRSLAAVRDVELRAAAFGVEAGTQKLFAYAMAGGLGGLGGALFGLQQGSLNELSAFDLQASLTLVAIVVVGGARSTVGVVLAAFLLFALPRLLPETEVTAYLPVAFAALLVLSVVRQPTGIGGVLRAVEDRLLRADEDRPSPRPEPVEPTSATQAAADLAKVPRRLSDRRPARVLLEAEQVSVQYGGVRALDSVTLEVRRGEVVGLIGANGAGKSTFFQAVSGLAPVTGTLRYRGRDLSTRRAAGRSAAGVARTFQDMGLVRAATVRENVLLPQGWLARYATASGLLGLGSSVSTERELRRRADLALDLFGLRHLASERLGDLPYGTMRVVEIAAAVAAGPELLMLDEASAGLTPEEAHGLGDEFVALRNELGLTLVVIEHHVPLIARTCDYCYCLESGALIAEGTPQEVTAQPAVVASFLGRGALEPAT
ncbi:MAG TPA: ATP-binding cassette domain-containing protein [Mycobacteriales bacterium]|nr:ATP-binding cassette domain-containing protein [Mycobacteriales bacterium]